VVGAGPGRPVVAPSERAAAAVRDRELVAAHLRGDRDAFAVIVHEHAQEMSLHAQRMLGSRLQAEDACQEAFGRALAGISRFGRTGEYRLGAWLHTILHHVCVDQLCRQSRERALGPVLVQPGDESDVADRVQDPARAREVRHALARLSPGLRRALVLRDVHGLSYLEVAAREHISPANARMRVHRARASLHDRLAGPAPADALAGERVGWPRQVAGGARGSGGPWGQAV
jgi:RNA polymerase sigma-70 factor (ECF subfamily)